MGVKNTVEYVTRYIETMVLQDLQRKMLFIGGPRQCRKTKMAKSLHRQDETNPDSRYLTPEDRENIIGERFPSGSGLLILDEIRKFLRWRQVVKGLFDKRGDHLALHKFAFDI